MSPHPVAVGRGYNTWLKCDDLIHVRTGQGGPSSRPTNSKEKKKEKTFLDTLLITAKDTWTKCILGRTETRFRFSFSVTDAQVIHGQQKEHEGDSSSVTSGYGASALPTEPPVRNSKGNKDKKLSWVRGSHHSRRILGANAKSPDEKKVPANFAFVFCGQCASHPRPARR